jgi:ketosteroid isomerase-like protein
MITTATSASTATADIEVVQTGFAAFAAGDLAGFAAGFHPDGTWNHRNDDQLGGVKDGIEAIVDFLIQSGQLTAGTLRAVPEGYLSDGEGRVAVRTRVSGTRPDGRTFDDSQMLLFVIEEGKVRSVDQFVGDPTAVTAFWA